jgi:hypothetical protein
MEEVQKQTGFTKAKVKNEKKVKKNLDLCFM